MIEPFESRKDLLVFQPPKANLSLRSPKLELDFVVSPDGLLSSRQMRAVIDNDQDAGTLYGLESALVLRDIYVPTNRSIIVPMGSSIISSSGGHPKIQIRHEGYYDA